MMEGGRKSGVPPLGEEWQGRGGLESVKDPKEEKRGQVKLLSRQNWKFMMDYKGKGYLCNAFAYDGLSTVMQQSSAYPVV
ncbi:hypothetical protein VNO77_41553 [Canavalia gladiata]|uniref:Uncharacterized protein n=1 Tax=Canavalia gladiata TaxID=3824 RepID=A0AAN9JYT5_CANGL